MERDTCRCWLLYKLLFLSCGNMKSKDFGLDVIKTGAFCYCLFTEAVSIGSHRWDLFKPGSFGADYLASIIDVGQWGQCTIHVVQKAKTLLFCCGGKQNGPLYPGGGNKAINTVRNSETILKKAIENKSITSIISILNINKPSVDSANQAQSGTWTVTTSGHCRWRVLSIWSSVLVVFMMCLHITAGEQVRTKEHSGQKKTAATCYFPTYQEKHPSCWYVT